MGPLQWVCVDDEELHSDGYRCETGVVRKIRGLPERILHFIVSGFFKWLLSTTTLTRSQKARWREKYRVWSRLYRSRRSNSAALRRHSNDILFGFLSARKLNILRFVLIVTFTFIFIIIIKMNRILLLFRTKNLH